MYLFDFSETFENFITFVSHLDVPDRQSGPAMGAPDHLHRQPVVGPLRVVDFLLRVQGYGRHPYPGLHRITLADLPLPIAWDRLSYFFIDTCQWFINWFLPLQIVQYQQASLKESDAYLIMSKVYN